MAVKALEGGIRATHPPLPEHLLLVGPATGEQRNVYRRRVAPLACWRVDDMRFEFDSSFVRPEMQLELEELAALVAQVRSEHPGTPPAALSVFGHADPSGDDDYNKHLSGRRAMAVYGMLIRDAEIWEDLYSHPHGGDDWGSAAIETMCATTGQGRPGSRQARKQLYLAYMDALCPLKLQRSDFLGNGADAGGKGDYQGCSEFNPVLVFSREDAAAYQSDHEQRNLDNAPNRRVVVFLFAPGVRVDPARWPCARAKDTVGICRKRFWSDGETRRSNQDQRREFKDTRDTFACRFYHRLASESPCEGVMPPAIPLVRVRLRLLWKDPDGKPRVFPPGMPVTVTFETGGELALEVGPDGALGFDAEPEKKSFTLRFEPPRPFLASAAGAPGPATETLLAAGEVAQRADQGFRIFQLPKKWSTLDTDWTAAGLPYADGRMLLTNDVGSDAEPAAMRLDPHWQYLQFTYFDRALLKKLSVPPFMLEGFRQAASAASGPDTRSNWTVGESAEECVECLPWILRQPPKPDKDVLVQFRFAPGTFISSNADGARFVLSLASLNPGGTAAARAQDPGLNAGKVETFDVEIPSAGRLRLYDLPKIWKSRGYSTFQLTGAEAFRFFEQAADAPTQAACPLVISLDDMVLMQYNGPLSEHNKLVHYDEAALAPLAKLDPAKERLAIFSHTFRGDGLDAGLYDPNTGDNEPDYSAAGFLDGRNYIGLYPDWTRLVIARGNLFDVFDKRTPERADLPVGARAAVCWLDLTPPSTRVPEPGIATYLGIPHPLRTPFLSIQAFHQQLGAVEPAIRMPGLYNEDNPAEERVEKPPPPPLRPQTAVYGRVDVAVLRCCGLSEDMVEQAVCLNYFRLFFNGNPSFKAGLQENAVPAGLSEEKAKAWGAKAITNLLKRWNGTDQSLGRRKFVPTGGQKVSFELVWLAQGVERKIAHIDCGIFKVKEGDPPPIRSSMGSDVGLGCLDETINKPGDKGDLPFAHEMGHASGLVDEYVERRFSAGLPCAVECPSTPAPGAPWFVEGPPIMWGGITVQGRYAWHIAECVRQLVGIELRVEYGSHKLLLPHHPRAPRRNYVNFPVVEARDVTRAWDPRLGQHAYFDAHLYTAGDDEYHMPLLKARGVLDGMLVLKVKLRVAVYTDDDATLRTAVGNLLAAGNYLFYQFAPMNAHGTRAGWTYKTCPIVLQPRVLVETISNDPKILELNQVGSSEEYDAELHRIAAEQRVPFRVRIKAEGPLEWRGPYSVEIGDDPAHADDRHTMFLEMLGLPGTMPVQPASLNPIVQMLIPGGTAEFAYKVGGP